MKKILFMVGSMNIGGVEKSLISLLSYIPTDKYEITVLVLEKKGVFLEHIPSYVTVKEAKWFKEIKPIIMQPPQDTIKEYLSNKKYIKSIGFINAYLIAKIFDDRYVYYKNILKSIPNSNESYDVAIAYAGPTEIIDAYIAHKVKAEKKIGWIHFDVSKHHINRKLYENLYKRFNKIFVVSEEAKRKLNEEIKGIEEKSEIFFNIISKDIIKEMAEEKIDFDKKFKGIKIVTVGRLTKEKGQDLAIKALGKLRKEGYDIKWYCTGEGSYRKEYEELIRKYGLEKYFILLGETSNPYPYMKTSDIYVQTSRHEGYCLTLAEAKCLNKPIVTTNFTGASEQLIDGENGYIVKCSDEELYVNIKKLIDNKNEMKRFNENLSNSNICTLNELNKLYSYID